MDGSYAKVHGNGMPAKARGAGKRLRQKGRREGGAFVLIPHAVIDSSNFRRCSGTAVKLLIGLVRQYRGNNNGDLAPALVPNGPAHQAKAKALRELVHYGLLVKTKHGGLGMPSLYALTWCAIDPCRNKLEVSATLKPPGDWKSEVPDFHDRPKTKAKAGNQHGQG